MTAVVRFPPCHSHAIWITREDTAWLVLARGHAGCTARTRMRSRMRAGFLRLGRWRVVDQRIRQAAVVLSQMEAGLVLHLSFSPSGQRWMLSSGERVASDVAELVVASSSVVANNDALFPDCCPGQTWRCRNAE
jgi:hypothetical protein